MRGTTRVGAPSFESQNVDFASWLSQFEVKAGAHWFVPKAPNPKLPCHVDLEFVVEHDGRSWTQRPSGAVDFDKSAVKALRAARFPPLPVGFQPPSVTMHVTFWFDEGEPPPAEH